MAEDTNKTPAASEPSMDELLTQAAGGEVEEKPTQEQVEQPSVEEQPKESATEEEQPPQTEEQLDEEGLPKGHKERSELGRKLAALHRRQDETAETLSRISQLLEKVAVAKTEQTPALETVELDPNEPVTYKEMLQLLEKREQQKVVAKTNYDKAYSATVERTLSEYIDEQGQLNTAEVDGVLEEMRSLRYTPTTDPEKDAISNIRKAERAFLKKQMAKPREKVNPLKGDAPKSPLGVAPSGKSPAKTQPAIRLDKDAEAYLKFVSASDGAERADKLRASMARGAEE